MSKSKETVAEQGDGIAPSPAPDAIEHELAEELAHWKDLAKRAQAEFENTRKRLEARRLEEVKYAGACMVEAIIPAIDDIDYALAHAAETGDDSEMVQGLAAIRLKLLDGLESQGVEVIDPVGQPFDAEFAQAICAVPTDEVEADTVMQVVQKGYCLAGKLIRPAAVTVSTTPAITEPPATEPDAAPAATDPAAQAAE
ncbi:MAG: nucleotide exchange factor GrpE [Coriobacteriia bacterium]|nr:nucleotide exchange factor GrpE [Coriobacteriia bacterium]